MTTTDDVIEELQKKYNVFLIDQFYSTGHLVEVVTQTGSTIKEIFNLELSTGIQANSTVKIYYDLNRFNPVYSKAYFRVRFNSVKDMFAFIGFNKTNSDPTYNMVQSHSGMIIYNNKAYLSTGNELGVSTGYQNNEISGIDFTRDMIIKIENNMISTMPMPQIIPYFDTFRIVADDRVWTMKTKNNTTPPEDLTHYIVFFIKNNTNEDKVMSLRHFCYLEEYAD